MQRTNLRLFLVILLSSWLALPPRAWSAGTVPDVPSDATIGRGVQTGQSQAKDWTILIYFDADNDVGDVCDKIISKMERAGTTDRVNIVVQLDRPGNTGTWRYLMKKGDQPDKITSQIVETLSEQDMGSPDTLGEFVRWGMKKYPARRYFLDLFSHGTGWEECIAADQPVDRAVVFDDHSGNHLSVVQIGEVLRGVTRLSGQKIEVLGYTACLMQTAEVAAEVSDSCLYQVGSEERTLDWPYDRWLTQVVAHPEWNGLQVSNALLDSFMEQVSGGDSYIAFDMSILDLSKFSELQTRAGAFVHAVLGSVGSKAKVVEAVNGTWGYHRGQNRDLVDFLDQILKKVEDKPVVDAANALRSFLRDQVVVKHGQRKDPHARSNGLAVYLPDYVTVCELNFHRKTAWSTRTQWSKLVVELEKR